MTDAARGEWLPKQLPAIERPTGLPPAVVVNSARRQSDPGPVHWLSMKSGQSLEQLGIYDSRFVFYRAKANSATETNLLIQHQADDVVLAMVNGKSARRSGGTASTTAFGQMPGSNDVRLFYENQGHANGGNAIEQPSGIFAARMTARALGDKKLVEGWRMREVDGTYNRLEVKSDFIDKDWTPVAVDKVEPDNLPSHHSAVYRASVELSAAELKGGKWNLSFGCVDDLGWVYVNGRRVGKTTDWSRPYSFNVTRRLHAGRNVIAVIVSNDEGGGGLGMPSLRLEPEGTRLRLTSFGTPDGIEDRWWEPNFDDTGWETVTFNAERAPSQPEALLTWYRMNFQLQPTQPGVWVPWRLHLNATGNGFLYLNGHPLGRYWQAGPQRDFFLPECWLNFGAGQTNVLTLSLRAADQGAAIQSAAVEPCAEFAEKR